MSSNRRILIGKPGLDGHDRGAKYIAQVLRDAGFVVIYTGIRRTPEQIVQAAVQEDVDAIGLSLLSGAHMELFGRVTQLLREAGVSDITLFGGGVIPPADAEELKRQGVAAVFTPGTPTASIVEAINGLLSPRPADAATIAGGLASSGSADAQRVRLAARLMTVLENEPRRLEEYRDAFTAAGGNRQRSRMVLGLTGAPGAGKSTLAGALVKAIRARHPDRRVGVIAVDPSSALTHGALLGDRIRMMHLSDDPKVFIRSLASQGQLGGLAPGLGGVLGAMELLGCDIVLIETVGVGQSEADIVKVADLTALVLAPGQGDDIQLLKAGVMEVADVLVVNKADHDDARTLYEHVLSSQADRRDLGRPEARVVMLSAVNGKGVEELVDLLDRTASEQSAAWRARRA